MYSVYAMLKRFPVKRAKNARLACLKSNIVSIMKISIKSITLWAAGVVMCTSCGQQQSKQIDRSGIVSGELKTVVVPKRANISVDSIIADVEFLKLGKTGDILIGEVEKLWITPRHIVVADKYKSKAIFVFDRSGNTQAIINRLGRGPQEYTDLTDVVLTPDKERIVVLDNSKKKLLYYAMNGDFLYDKDLPFNATDLEYVDEQKIMVRTYEYQKNDPNSTFDKNNRHYVYVLDTLMNLTHSAMSTPPFIKRFEDRLYVNPAHSDTIYRVAEGGSLVPQYKIDMTAIDGVSNFGKEPMEKIMEIRKNNSYFPNAYVDGKDFALFNIAMPLDKPNYQLILHDKHTGQNYSIEGSSTHALNIYFMESQYVCDDRFVSAIPAFRFVSDNSRMPGFEMVETIKEGLTDEDNPVLLFYTLKVPNDSPVD